MELPAASGWTEQKMKGGEARKAGGDMCWRSGVQASGSAPRGQTGQPWKAGSQRMPGPAAAGWILAPGVEVQVVCPSGHPGAPQAGHTPLGDRQLCHKDHTEVVWVHLATHTAQRRVSGRFLWNTQHKSCFMLSRAAMAQIRNEISQATRTHLDTQGQEGTASTLHSSHAGVV